MSGMNEQAIMEILEKIRYRFYGKYRGSVTEVDEDTLRIKATVPAVLGDQPTGWCMPCVPYAGDGVGMAFIPEEGAGVWIEFEGGDVSYPIWTGCYWRSGELPSDAKPNVKTIVTSQGDSKILMDNDAGSITLLDPNNNQIKMDSSGIAIQDTNQNQATLDSSGIALQDLNENQTTMDTSGVTLTCGGSSVAVGQAEVSVNDGALEVT
jgi:uncharacterized protein involved in type VI secretion and phage assembly